MIAKITRGSNPGNIGAYLHGPGHANEHFYERNGSRYPGGVVVGGNVFVTGDADEKAWVKEMRAAMRNRPEIKKPVWQASLRNTANDRLLSDTEWADAGQSFAERMGFDEHPWVMIRHGDDHVHIVVSRVNDLGEIWHARNDRRTAQTACAQLEQEYGLEQAPRRRVQAKKRSVLAQRVAYQDQSKKLADQRRELEALRTVIAAEQGLPGVQKSTGRRLVPAAEPSYQDRQRRISRPWIHEGREI